MRKVFSVLILISVLSSGCTQNPLDWLQMADDRGKNVVDSILKSSVELCLIDASLEEIATGLEGKKIERDKSSCDPSLSTVYSDEVQSEERQKAKTALLRLMGTGDQFSKIREKIERIANALEARPY